MSLIDANKGHNAWLDWLRFGAAFAVVLTHARSSMFVQYSELDEGSRNPLTILWFATTRQGHEAVMVFFVLSGFFVGGGIINQIRAGTFNVTNYAIDRSARILVPLFPAVLLTASLMLAVGMPVEMWTLSANMASLQGAFAPVLPGNWALWSLTYEVWFYILGGALGFLAARRDWKNPLAWVAILAALAVFSQLIVLYVLIWAAGAIAAAYPAERPTVKKLIAGLLLAIVGVALYQWVKPNGVIEGTVGSKNSLSVRASEVIMAVGMAYALTNIAVVRMRNESALAKLGTFLASFSYSLYLIHLPLLMVHPQKDSRTVDGYTFSLYVSTIIAIMITAYMYASLFEFSAYRLKLFVKARVSKWSYRTATPDLPLTDDTNKPAP